MLKKMDSKPVLPQIVLMEECQKVLEETREFSSCRFDRSGSYITQYFSDYNGSRVSFSMRDSMREGLFSIVFEHFSIDGSEEIIDKISLLLDRLEEFARGKEEVDNISIFPMSDYSVSRLAESHGYRYLKDRPPQFVYKETP